jgi:hypothetical protein
MNEEKLKHQLFIGKVTDVIGMEKTLELLKEVKDALEDIPSKDSNQYVIINLRTMDFMKSQSDGKITYYDTLEDACIVCGMYELEDSWVMKLMYNHIEELKN